MSDPLVRRFAPLLLLVLLASACGGAARVQPPPAHLTHFKTSSGEDGLRFFTYQVDMPRAAARGPVTASSGRQPDMSREANPRGRDRERFEESLDAGLRLKLEETGYCPDGFMILERYTLPGRATLRGECM